jgi:hypothetical protein
MHDEGSVVREAVDGEPWGRTGEHNGELTGEDNGGWHWWWGVFGQRVQPLTRSK